MSNARETKLIEAIVLAKDALEDVVMGHEAWCPMEDPHMQAPCRCGADIINAKLTKARKALKEGLES